MPLENATTIAELDPANPLGSDSIGDGDNHIRMIKQVLQNEEVFQIKYYTVAEAVALPGLTIGREVFITDRAKYPFRVVLTGGVEPNGVSVLQSTVNPTLSLQIVLSGITPISAYGIALDNTTNFDVAFQLLLDESPRVDLEGSTLTIFNTINLNKDQKIVNGVIKQADTFTGELKQTAYAGSGPYNNRPGLYAENKTDIKFQEVELDGNNAGRAAPVGFSSSIVFLQDCTDVKFRDCDVHNNAADQGTLEGGAIFMNGGTDHDFIGGKIHDIQDEGWHSRANNTSVKGARLKNSTSSLVGSQLLGGVEGEFGRGLVVIGCPEVSGCPNGAAISVNHKDSVVSGCVISDSKHAIILGHRTSFARRSPADNTTLNSNVLKDTTSSAIQIQYGKNTNVVGGSITNAGTDGDLNLSYAIQCVSWSGGGNICGVSIDGAPGAIRLSPDTSDVDETVIPNWKVATCDIDNIIGYGIRSDDCSGTVAIGMNTIKKVNTAGVSSRAAISVFTDYANLESTTPSVIIKGNDIGDADNDCFRPVSISISNQPDSVVRHKVKDNDAVNASVGYVYSPPSLVLRSENSLDGVFV